MSDIFSSEKRSEIMSKVRGKDTKPEIVVRKALHNLGYRYTLHKKSLPGKPDMYFRKYNAVIEVNGCFWHGHDCHLFTIPKTNTDFWKNKIENNRHRDQNNLKRLRKIGLRILIIWECATKGKTSMDFSDLIESIEKWLHSDAEFKELEGNK